MKFFENEKELRRWFDLLAESDRRLLSTLIRRDSTGWTAKEQVILFRFDCNRVWRLVAREVRWELVPEERKHE